MISHTTSRFWKAYKKLTRAIRKQAREAYRQLRRTLTIRTLEQADILRAGNMDYRAVGIKDGEEIVWHWIGPHDEYEKLIERS